MLSGGFELGDLNPFNYDYSLDYFIDNVEFVGDTGIKVVSGAAEIAIGILSTPFGCKSNHVDVSSANIEDLPPGQACFISSNDPDHFNKLYSDGTEDYADDHNMGGCVQNLSQDAFDFWCYGVEDGVLFDDDDWFSDDDGNCSAWRVYNFDNKQPVCGNRIFHTADWGDISDLAMGNTKLDDDYDEIFLVMAVMELLNPGEIPGIARWDASLVEAGATFVYPAKLIRKDQMLRGEFLKLFAPLTRLSHLSTQSAEQQIFNSFSLVGNELDVDKLLFSSDWRGLDFESVGNDWVTPLIHAVTIYDLVKQFYETHWERLLNNLDTFDDDLGDFIWYVDEDNAHEVFIVQNDNIDPSTNRPARIPVRSYSNDIIWRRPGEDTQILRSDLITEINNAADTSRRRCYNCSDEHEFARKVLHAISFLNRFDGFQLVVPYDECYIEELRERAQTRGSRRNSIPDCCHMEPPRVYDANAGRCSQKSAHEICFNLSTPRMFDYQRCDCSLEAGATICLNVEPRGTHIFIFNSETGESECIRCEEPAPVTSDGINCESRPRTRRNPPVQTQNQGSSTQWGGSNPWSSN